MCHPHEKTSRAPGCAWSRTASAVPDEQACTPRGTSTTSTPSQPATARLMTSRSSVAPGTMLIRSSNSASLPTLCSRQTAITSYPRSSACWTMYLPSFPDAPTMQIFMPRDRLPDTSPSDSTQEGYDELRCRSTWRLPAARGLLQTIGATQNEPGARYRFEAQGAASRPLAHSCELDEQHDCGKAAWRRVSVQKSELPLVTMVVAPASTVLG